MPFLTNMCQLSGTEKLGREECIRIQVEKDLSGYFLHSNFELTLIEVIHGRSSLDYIRVNAVRLSTWAIRSPFKIAGTRVIGGFRIAA